jgi:uncharacterized protein YoxC
VLYFSWELPMDLQLILIFILALLTINLIIVGAYVILVLKELRQTVKKTNTVLDDVNAVTNAVSSPVASILGIATSVLEGVKTIKSVRTLLDNSEEKHS